MLDAHLICVYFFLAKPAFVTLDMVQLMLFLTSICAVRMVLCSSYLACFGMYLPYCLPAPAVYIYMCDNVVRN